MYLVCISSSTRILRQSLSATNSRLILKSIRILWTTSMLHWTWRRNPIRHIQNNSYAFLMFICLVNIIHFYTAAYQYCKVIGCLSVCLSVFLKPPQTAGPIWLIFFVRRWFLSRKFGSNLILFAYFCLIFYHKYGQSRQTKP